MAEQYNRRDVIKKIAVLASGSTAVVVLPARWTKPMVESIITPANAATIYSYCDVNTGTWHYAYGSTQYGVNNCTTTTAEPD